MIGIKANPVVIATDCDEVHAKRKANAHLYFIMLKFDTFG